MPISMAKVLIVIARLNIGGTSQYIAHLVAGLERAGYEVLIATGRVQGSELEDGIVAKLPIRRVESLGRKISPVADLKARREIREVISEFSPDLVYSHTFKAGLLVRSLKLPMPIIHAFHGHLLSEPELAGWRSKIVIFFERLLAKRAKYLVTVGKRVADELLAERVGRASQYRSIPPGVIPIDLEQRDKGRKELGITGEMRPIVVWMARVVAVKGPMRVLEIARKIPEARFLLAGGGDLLDEISRDIPENLSILGWQPSSRIWAVADIAISTSENEGMPVALIEAQLAGVPVVALDVGSVGEVILDGKTGYLFSEFNQSYIEKVRELILDKKQIEQMASASKKWATAQFSPEKMVKMHIELFEEILAR
jgi:glycosyltransferase involved in cell wall biosynthesis